MLLSCWSRRMLSNVPHRPPLMFWQLAHRAWHPLGAEDRAAPKPKLANLTWHERGDTDLGRCLRKQRQIGGERWCRRIYIHRLKVRKRGCCGTSIYSNITVNVNLAVLVIHNTKTSIQIDDGKDRVYLVKGASQTNLCGNLFLETNREFGTTSCHVLLFVWVVAQLLWVSFCPNSQASSFLWQKEFTKWSWRMNS